MLKEKLISAHVIIAPDWSLPFELMCHSSDYPVEEVLGQIKNKLFHAIYYSGKVLNKKSSELCNIRKRASSSSICIR